MAYTNISNLVERARDLSRKMGNQQDEARELYKEFIRVGGETRLSPFFFELDGTTPRTDLPYSFAELVGALSAMNGLTGGDAGTAAILDAWRAALDKVKS